jgi:hypothetical protein
MWFGSCAWLTTSCILCRKYTDLTWDEDEPSAAVAEEESVPATEESTPPPQAKSEAPTVEATLLEASIVEGEYSARAQSSSRSSRNHQGRLIRMSSVDRGEAEGSTIPEVVPVEALARETQGAAGAAPEPTDKPRRWPERSVTMYCQSQPWR